MIKNEIQLATAKSRFANLISQLAQLNTEYAGIELELLADPINDEVEKIEGQIHEYLTLRELSLDQALEAELIGPMVLENIGQLLAKIRIAAGFTQEAFAEHLGWKQSNLSRFENPNNSSQTIRKVVEYSSALGVWLYVRPSTTELAPSFSAFRRLTDWITVRGIELEEDVGIYSIDSDDIEYRQSQSDLSPLTETRSWELEPRQEQFEYA